MTLRANDAALNMERFVSLRSFSKSTTIFLLAFSKFSSKETLGSGGQ